MLRSQEHRSIDYFISSYNSVRTPKISRRLSDRNQDCPDAICLCEDGKIIALEHTSAYPPKGRNKPRYVSPYKSLLPLNRVLERKLKNDYKDQGVDETWLFVNIRPTLPRDLITRNLRGLPLPGNFNRIFLLWPVLEKNGVRCGILEIPENKFWIPEFNPAA